MPDADEHPTWGNLTEAMEIVDWVSAPTLRKWADGGYIRQIRTPGNQRRYALDDCRRIAREGVTVDSP